MVHIDQSNRPFGQALVALLEELGMSRRELSRQLQRRYDWGSHGLVRIWAAGEATPGLQQMERVAATLQIDPNYFAEYRLMKVRNSLDPDIVGLKPALKNLAALTGDA